jgi:CubicO group peptidase (beta-lactamase class C family)
MRSFSRLGAMSAAVLAALLARCSPAAEPEWQAASPQSQGMDPDRLEALRESLAAKRTKALLVLRNDRVVLEWYAPGHGAQSRHYTASMAKGIVGGLAAAVALSDGRLALDDPAAKFIPQWNGDPQKARITLRQLGSHASGLEDAEADGLPHEKLSGWKGDFWKRLPPPGDPFSIARDRTPLLFEPGAEHSYSNPGIAMLGYAVTAALAGSPHRDLRALLRERVMRPLGVPDSEWSVGYGQTFEVAGLKLVGTWGGGSYTARAVARVGALLLRAGEWRGERLLDPAAARAITGDAGTPGHGGIGWWSNESGKYPRLPSDAFWASGAGHQVLLVVPSLALVAVRNGEVLSGSEEHHDALNSHLFAPLLECIVADPPADRSAGPYPPSPVIRRIGWAPKETIVRKARGSDNWPLTWADDDHLYTAYGDGNGFEPHLEEKLSMGFARVEGGPEDFRGVNLRSPSGETKGDGKAGKKASGLLMVDGVLYLLARNAGNSQLAWSMDRGLTWTWSDWKFTTSFGCPTFLNFGRNYDGARDDHVYIYSPDHDSAYEPADRMVLARAPKERLRERGAYEFFRGLDASGGPIWTRDIAERGAVFNHPGKCYRGGITYNPGLRRYLWCQILPGGEAPRFRPGSDPRFAGGFAVYDAPEPWGPWTTAYYVEKWDVGPGETSSFPAKWMSAGGGSMHLVFSGDDAFSVRRATLTLAAD